MTRAEKLASARLGAELPPLNKEAWSLLPKALGAVTRYGGKALTGAGRFGAARVAQGAGSGGAWTGAATRAGQSLQNAGNQMYAYGRKLHAARPRALPSNPSQYPFGLRAVNQGLDRFASRGGIGRRALRGIVGTAIPKTYAGGAKNLALLGLAGDRYMHGQRLADAGNYGAARAIHELRQSPFSSGLGALFGSSDMVARGLEGQNQAGVANYMRQFAKEPKRVDSALTQIGINAYTPFASTLFPPQ